MRELEINLAGTTITLVANFKASMQLNEKVADPLYIAREAALESMMGQRGLPYNPRWMFTVDNIPLILHIGAKAGESKLTLEQVQELVFEEGFANSRDFAIEYIGLLVGPAPTETVDEDKEPSEGN